MQPARIIKPVLTVIVILIHINGFAQAGASMYVKSSGLAGIYDFYYRQIGVEEKLINGKEYIPYYFRSGEKPVLFYGKAIKGSLVIDGRRYRDINLQYDIFTDQLIYTDTTRFYNNIAYQIELNRDPVWSFTLYPGADSMYFWNIGREEAGRIGLKPGYYEVVYNGKSSYLIKHFSTMIDKSGVDEYYNKTAGYIIVGNRCARTGSPGKILKLFGERSDEARHYLRSAGINLHKAGKKEIAGLVEFYDSIKKQE